MEEYKALTERTLGEVVKKLNQWKHQYHIEVLSHKITDTTQVYHHLIIKRTPKEE